MMKWMRFFCLLAAVLFAAALSACGSPAPVGSKLLPSTATIVPPAPIQATAGSWPTATRWPSPTPIPRVAVADVLKPASPSPLASPTPAPTALPATSVAPTAVSNSVTGPAVTISSPTANIRSGPGVAYPIIGSANQGQQFAVIGRVASGDWWQVEYNGKPAWVAVTVSAANPSAAQTSIVTLLPPTPEPAVPQTASGPAQASEARANPPASAGAGHIAFASGRGDTSDIAVLDIATGKVSILASDGRQPDMRWDGHIVFKGAGNGRNNLFTVRPDGSNLTQVGARAEDQYPQWAPGKTYLTYFTTNNEGRQNICVQFDTSQPVGDTIFRLEWIPDREGTPNPVYGRFPTWIANNRIVFAGCDAWLAASNCGLWAVDTGEYRNFRPFPLTANDQDRPSDSFGETLLFSGSGTGNWEIYSIRTTLPTHKYDPKPQPANLTNNGAPDVGATFSPDGKSIAFISNRGGWGIWVMNADGTSQRLLAPVPQGFGPHWDEERLSWGP